MRAVCAALALTASGCNAVLGLDPPAIGDGKHDAGPDHDSTIDGDPPMLGDEDADGIDDAIDNCPHVANPFQETDETGAAGAGIACDPRPGLAGDELVAFAGFHGGLPIGWQQTGPSWQLVGDDIRWTPTNGAFGFVGPTWTNIGADAARRIQVQAAMTITAIDDTLLQQFGVWLNYDAPDGTGYTCNVTEPVGGPLTRAQSRHMGAAYFHLSSSDQPGANVEQRFEFTLIYTPLPTPEHVQCKIAYTSPVMFPPNNDPTYTSGQVGVHVTGVTANVHYVVLYSSPNM